MSAEKVIPECECAECLCKVCKDKDDTNAPQRECDEVSPAIPDSSKTKVGDAENHPPDCDCPVCLCKPCGSITPNPPETLPPECDCNPCYCDPCGECVGKGGDAAGEVSLKKSHPPDCACADCSCDPCDPQSQKIHSPNCDCDICNCIRCAEENKHAENEAENKKTAALHPEDCDCQTCKCEPCESFTPNPPETLPPECDCSPCYCNPCGKCVNKAGDAAEEVPLKKNHPSDCNCADCLCDPCALFPQNAPETLSPECDCPACYCDPCGESVGKAGDTTKEVSLKRRHSPDCDCADCSCVPCDSDLPTPQKIRSPSDAAQVSLKKPHSPDCDCADCLCIPCDSDLPTPQKIRSPSDAAQVSLKKPHSPDCDCAECLCIPCDSDLPIPQKILSPTPQKILSPTPQKIRSPSNAVQVYLKKYHSPDCDCVNCLNNSCEPHIPTPQKIHSPSCDCVTCYCAPCVEEKKHPEGCDCCSCSVKSGGEPPKSPGQIISAEKPHPEDCDCADCICEKDKIQETAEKPHPEDCDCVDCIFEKAKVQEATAEKPHPEDCDCADCVWQKDQIQEPAEISHPEDCDCLDCICEKAKVQEAISEKSHPEDCDCVDCICEKGIKTDTTEIVKAQEVVNEVLCACDEAEIQAANAKEPPLLTATVSGLKLAIQCVKKKCKQRDCMIAALIKELELKSDSNVFDNMLHELAMANTTDINYQRSEIFNSLGFDCQPCDHPDYPNCPCAKALTCSHPNYPNCPCGTDQAMYLLRFPTGNKRESLASHEESACPCPDEEIELESEFLCGKGSQTCTHDNFPNCPCIKTKKSKQPQTSLPCSPKKDVKKIASTIPFTNTVSGFQLSLENAQEKCKLKDFIIAVMINELETRSNKKLSDDMLRKLATAISHTDIDFDRTQVCNILKRPPKVKPTSGCTHPKHPDNCSCGAHDIKQASPQCPRPDGTCPCSSQKPKAPKSRCTCKSKKCPCK